MRYRVVLKRAFLACAGLAICLLASSLRGLVILVLLCICAFYVQRVLWRLSRRRGINRFRFFPTYASAGNALQNLQMLAEPQIENVIQEKSKDEVDDGDDGEPEDENNLINDQLGESEMEIGY